MPALPTEITIGELALRSGVATSALRFYEARGLITSDRTSGGQRRFARPTLRRVAFIQAAQRVGLSLDEIAKALRTLPEHRTPTKADWAVLSRSWKDHLRSRIEDLETLQTRLTSCIGCGCLSLKTCSLLNDADKAADLGSGRAVGNETAVGKGGITDGNGSTLATGTARVGTATGVKGATDGTAGRFGVGGVGVHATEASSAKTTSGRMSNLPTSERSKS